MPPKPTPTTVAQHLAGSAQSWHGTVSNSLDSPFAPEAGRYRLYIGLFCPFAHRANLVRVLKGLDSIIPITTVKPYPKGDDTGYPGWQFPSTSSEYPGADPDPLFGSKYLYELYFKADSEYKGRYSVPVLWDTQTSTIVNNESAELMRDLQTSFNPLLSPENAAITLYPEHLREEIEKIAGWMQKDLNTGVYKAGFAKTQEAYDAAVPRVFAALNKLEKTIHQNGGPYILGKHLTELDIRAYATIVRFDTVYVQHFKCNLGTIRHDYPQINRWLKNLYWNVPGFKETTDFKHIKENYTKSHGDINPRAITPMGPYPDVEEWSEGEGEKGFSEGKIGGVKMPAVLDIEKQLD
ncbi:glutathione S-transferase [Diplogelasinospora grovesii]|uniref:Glutathione S-transferase n=1 Tax=Diplogelasinospora grovesii TaxID=303347 RepID=A0AAN6N1U7_9PEZI|nr:glutathione S-transferase [Diplogelasinospora grovesii]